MTCSACIGVKRSDMAGKIRGGRRWTWSMALGIGPDHDGVIYNANVRM